MPRNVKITPKEIKKPDRFRESLANAIFFASENYRKILVAFGVAILILAVVFVVNNILERRDLGANSEFAEAMKGYMGGGSPEDSEKTVNKFLDIRKKYPRAEVSKVALYYAAEIDYDMGKYDESISLLNNLLKSGVKDQMLLDASYLRLGTANFMKGNWQQTIDYLSKLDKEGNPYRDQAKLYIALSLEKLGKFSESEKTYKQILNSPDNNLKLQVEKKVEGK